MNALLLPIVVGHAQRVNLRVSQKPARPRNLGELVDTRPNLPVLGADRGARIARHLRPGAHKHRKSFDLHLVDRFARRTDEPVPVGLDMPSQGAQQRLVGGDLVFSVHAASTRGGGAGVVTGSLSAREKQVLSCSSKGLTDQQAANDLGISLGTIRVYSRRARRKLGTVDQVTDVLEAIRRGEIQVEGAQAVGR